jgi:hypothetical protein
MGWFKVDDQLAFHSKTVMAGNTAMGLWVRAGAWASAQLTDGKVPKHMAKAMANQEDADALVMAGLWVDDGDDYRFHDWDVFQPSAAKEKARREEISRVRSEAGRKGAQAKWEKERAAGKDGKPDGNTVTTDQQPESKPMAPSRPVPSRPEEEKEQAPDSAESTATPREDVQEVIDHLMAALKANDVRKAKSSKAWEDAARLMIDKDGYTVEQIKWITDWATNNHFWKGNILSMPKLREKFDQLKIQAVEEANGGGRKSGSEQRLARGLALVQAAEGREFQPSEFPAEIANDYDTDPFALEA